MAPECRRADLRRPESRSPVACSRRTARGIDRRRRLACHRAVAVGERHPALPLDHRRRPLRRRRVPPDASCPPPTSRSTTPGTRRGCAAPARSTSPSTTCSCPSITPSSRVALGPSIDYTARRLPQLLAARRRRRRRRPRHRPPRDRRARRPGRPASSRSSRIRSLAEHPYTPDRGGQGRGARSAPGGRCSSTRWRQRGTRRPPAVRSASIGASTSASPRSNAVDAAVAATDTAYTLAGGIEPVLVASAAALPARRPRGDPAHHGRAQAVRGARPGGARPRCRRRHAVMETIRLDRRDDLLVATRRSSRFAGERRRRAAAPRPRRAVPPPQARGPGAGGDPHRRRAGVLGGRRHGLVPDAALAGRSCSACGATPSS